MTHRSSLLGFRQATSLALAISATLTGHVFAQSAPPPVVSAPALKQLILKPLPQVMTAVPPASAGKLPSAAQPLPGKMPGGTPAASGMTIPFRTHTAGLEVIGSASTEIAPVPPFTPLHLTTAGLSVVGSAGGDVAPVPPFTPVHIRTESLQVVGTPGG